MLKARDYSLQGGRQELRGNAIVVFDGKDNPVVLVVAVSPVLTQIFSLEKPAEFEKALKQYGVAIPEDISDLEL